MDTNDKNTTRPTADSGPVIDDYIIECEDPNIDGCVISFDEDAYCVTASHQLSEFITLDFEWFRAKCAERNWSFHLLAF